MYPPVVPPVLIVESFPIKRVPDLALFSTGIDDHQTTIAISFYRAKRMVTGGNILGTAAATPIIAGTRYVCRTGSERTSCGDRQLPNLCIYWNQGGECQ
jgi:hypothetical protein